MSFDGGGGGEYTARVRGGRSEDWALQKRNREINAETLRAQRRIRREIQERGLA